MNKNGKIYNYLRCTKHKVEYEADRLYRRFNKKSNKFKSLEIYKNIHSGERCWIIGTGPSLTMEDLNKLKNEYTFVMNSFVKILNKIDFAPSYYGIQDGDVFERLESEIANSSLETIFLADSKDTNMKRLEKMPESIRKRSAVYPLNVSYHSYKMNFTLKYFAKFSDDITDVVYDGSTIAYSLLQIAVYMGFKEIYLIGTDCNYKTNGKNHFVEHGFVTATNPDIVGWRMIQAYKVAKKYADSHGVKIFNATRGGMLEVFPRVNLDNAL